MRIVSLNGAMSGHLVVLVASDQSMCKSSAFCEGDYSAPAVFTTQVKTFTQQIDQWLG